MMTCGPAYWSGEDPSLTRLRCLFAGASSADVSPYTIGSGTNTGTGTVNTGYYEVTVTNSAAARTLVWSHADLGKPVGVPMTAEFIFEMFEDSANPTSVMSFGAVAFFLSRSLGVYINGYAGAVLNANEFYVADTVVGSTYVGAADFLGVTGTHHFALCCNATGTYNGYLDGARIFGPTAGTNFAGATGRMELGGVTGGAGQPTRFRFYAVRIRRQEMYTGATYTVPTTFSY